jgi:hypothetical protein
MVSRSRNGISAGWVEAFRLRTCVWYVARKCTEEGLKNYCLGTLIREAIDEIRLFLI